MSYWWGCLALVVLPFLYSTWCVALRERIFYLCVTLLLCAVGLLFRLTSVVCNADSVQLGLPLV